MRPMTDPAQLWSSSPQRRHRSLAWFLGPPAFRDDVGNGQQVRQEWPAVGLQGCLYELPFLGTSYSGSAPVSILGNHAVSPDQLGVCCRINFLSIFPTLVLGICSTTRISSGTDHFEILP
jgi:hypothetical protein